MSQSKFLYRLFTDWAYEGMARVSMTTFLIHKETPCGAWIRFNGVKKFVRLRDWRGGTPTKRWACPTPEEAVVSFRARTSKRIDILKGQLQQAETALAVSSREGFRPQEPVQFAVDDGDSFFG